MSAEVILKKKLVKSEVQKGFVRVPNYAMKMFPRGSFKLIVRDMELIRKVDKNNRIYFGLNDIAKAGDEIIFWKKPDGTLAVEVESSTESYQQPQTERF